MAAKENRQQQRNTKLWPLDTPSLQAAAGVTIEGERYSLLAFSFLCCYLLVWSLYVLRETSMSAKRMSRRRLTILS